VKSNNRTKAMAFLPVDSGISGGNNSALNIVWGNAFK
jgi:hypothetical protein